MKSTVDFSRVRSSGEQERKTQNTIFHGNSNRRSCCCGRGRFSMCFVTHFDLTLCGKNGVYSVLYVEERRPQIDDHNIKTAKWYNVDNVCECMEWMHSMHSKQHDTTHQMTNLICNPIMVALHSLPLRLSPVVCTWINCKTKCRITACQRSSTSTNYVPIAFGQMGIWVKSSVNNAREMRSKLERDFTRTHSENLPKQKKNKEIRAKFPNGQDGRLSSSWSSLCLCTQFVSHNYAMQIVNWPQNDRLHIPPSTHKSFIFWSKTTIDNAHASEMVSLNGFHYNSISSLSLPVWPATTTSSSSKHKISAKRSQTIAFTWIRTTCALGHSIIQCLPIQTVRATVARRPQNGHTCCVRRPNFVCAFV